MYQCTECDWIGSDPDKSFDGMLICPQCDSIVIEIDDEMEDEEN